MSRMQFMLERSLLARYAVVVKFGVWLGALAAIAALGALRAATGAEFVFMSAVLLPIMVVSWIGGMSAGFSIAAIASCAWAAADLHATRHFSADWIPLVNGMTSFALYALFVGLLVALRNALHRVSELARRDGLTGLLNRSAFVEAGLAEWRRARRYGTPTALVYIDLDQLKTLNDSRGHNVGDTVLRTVGAALGRAVRESDTVARMGGDEFAVVLPSTSAPAAREFADRIQRSLRAALTEFAPVTASLGVACSDRPPAESFEALLMAADELMYETKRHGGDAAGCLEGNVSGRLRILRRSVDAS